MMDDSRALIITVNFRQAECTLQFLSSASRLEEFAGCHLVIVDNNSGDDSLSRIAKAIVEFPNVELLASAQNRGYFGAASWALRHYLSRNNSPAWLVVCNNDIAFSDSRLLVRLFENDPAAAGATAPSIFSGVTGRDQNPFLRHRPSALRMHVYKWVFRSRTLLNLTEAFAVLLKKLKTHFTREPGNAGRSNRQSGHHSNSGDDRIYAPHGSFLILSKEYFTRGGNLDFPGFLFGEEIYIAETIRRLGLRVVYRPDLEVVHQEHRSTRLFKSRKLAADVAFSAAYCADAFFPLRARNRVVETERFEN